MNIKELIEKYEYLNHNYFRRVDTSEVLRDLKQLDEPQKVTIPQFVADWIEVCKEHLTHSLYTAMTPNFMKENGQSLDLILWIKKASNQDIFARAWLDGYEVEKEKRYTVKIKGEIEENLLVYGLGINRYFFTRAYDYFFTRAYDSSKRNEHTRKQLEEAGFGWVFDCEGIEVEEVTE